MVTENINAGFIGLFVTVIFTAQFVKRFVEKEQANASY